MLSIIDRESIYLQNFRHKYNRGIKLKIKAIIIPKTKYGYARNSLKKGKYKALIITTDQSAGLRLTKVVNRVCFLPYLK